jgi:hypothetical protein
MARGGIVLAAMARDCPSAEFILPDLMKRCLYRGGILTCGDGFKEPFNEAAYTVDEVHALHVNVSSIRVKLHRMCGEGVDSTLARTYLGIVQKTM